MIRLLLLLFFFSTVFNLSSQTIRELGVSPGVLSPGRKNAITDVEGVTVGHTTLIRGDSIRTGVTAVLPHSGNIFQEKVPAAIYVGNGFGKLTGSTQVNELGNIETPIVLTNTLSVPTACNALISYILEQVGNEKVRSVNAVVGETNDGWLNDIRGRQIQEAHVLEAIKNANSDIPGQGNIGAGTGTVCFGFKGGIGTSSRKLPDELGGFTVGVLVQSNFGGNLVIDSFPAGEKLGKYPFKNALRNNEDGSCMIVVATDAPILHRNLMRLAKRAMLGLAKTGGIASNGSGDYVIAFSTATENRIIYGAQETVTHISDVQNNRMSSLFMAAIEATEEAILNSLFMAETMEGNGKKIEALPKKLILEMMNED